MVRTAQLYYEGELTQEAVSDILGISRQKVSRLLIKAKDQGIVQTRVVCGLQVARELEEELVRRFALKAARVVSVFSEDGQTVRRSVGQAAAEYLRRIVEPNTVIGVSYGRTLYEMVRFLQPREVPNVQVVQIMGGLSKISGHVVAVEIARRLGEAFEGNVNYLYAPAFTTDETTRNAMLCDTSIRSVLSLGEKADIAVVGIGDVSEESTLIRTGEITREEFELLKRQGAVGDICGTFFNIRGEIMELGANQRRVAISLPRLRAVRYVIGMAGGREKANAILGALRGGFINVLITDDRTADQVLEMHAG